MININIWTGHQVRLCHSVIFSSKLLTWYWGKKINLILPYYTNSFFLSSSSFSLFLPSFLSFFFQATKPQRRAVRVHWGWHQHCNLSYVWRLAVEGRILVSDDVFQEISANVKAFLKISCCFLFVSLFKVRTSCRKLKVSEVWWLLIKVIFGRALSSNVSSYLRCGLLF